MQGFCRVVACRDGVDGEFRTCIHVSAHEDIRLSGLIGQLIRHDGRTVEGHVLALQQIAPDASLAYRENQAVTINPDGLIFVIGRREATSAFLTEVHFLKMIPVTLPFSVRISFGPQPF